MDMRKLIPLSTFVLMNCAFTQASMATFSGTNGKIAFHSYKDEPAGIQTKVEAMNPNGSGRTTIYDNPSLRTASLDHPSLDFPRWSPDGKKLAVGGYSTTASEVYTMNTDGKRLVRITNLGGIRPTWSPDGKKLAYYTDYDFGLTRSPGIKVATINVDRSDNRRQTNEALGLFDHIDWANNGKIFFGADPLGAWRSVLSIEPKFGAPAPIAPATKIIGSFSEFSGQPSVAPDNKNILHFFRTMGAFDPSKVEPAGLYLSNIDGTNRTLVTTNVTSEGEAVWSPDGKKIAYVKEGDIYVADITDGALVRDTNITNTPDIVERQIDWGPTAS